MFDPSTLVEYNTVFPDTFDTTGAKLGAQLFTSMIADLRQVINGGFEFSRCLNVTFSWRKGCDNNGVSMLTQKRRFVFFTFLIGVNVCTNGTTPSRKSSIKAPAKWRNFVYVLTDIYNQIK